MPLQAQQPNRARKQEANKRFFPISAIVKERRTHGRLLTRAFRIFSQAATSGREN